MRIVSEIVETLTRCLEAKDPYTAFHSDRVAAIARDIALEMGLSPDQVRAVQTGAKLHDIGKLKVPEAVLRKEGGLSRGVRFRRQGDRLAVFPAVAADDLFPSLEAIVPLAVRYLDDGEEVPASVLLSRVLGGLRVPFAARA